MRKYLAMVFATVMVCAAFTSLAAADLGSGMDGKGDNDRDGLTNAQEFVWGTDPNDPDSDAGGAYDGWEVWYETHRAVSDIQTGANFLDSAYHFDPNSALDEGKVGDLKNLIQVRDGDANKAVNDPDDDGWNNFHEFLAGSDPTNPNTDGDSYKQDSADPDPLVSNDQGEGGGGNGGNGQQGQGQGNGGSGSGQGQGSGSGSGQGSGSGSGSGSGNGGSGQGSGSGSGQGSGSGGQGGGTGGNGGGNGGQGAGSGAGSGAGDQGSGQSGSGGQSGGSGSSGSQGAGGQQGGTQGSGGTNGGGNGGGGQQGGNNNKPQVRVVLSTSIPANYQVTKGQVFTISGHVEYFDTMGSVWKPIDSKMGVSIQINFTSGETTAVGNGNADQQGALGYGYFTINCVVPGASLSGAGALAVHALGNDYYADGWWEE